MRTDSEVLVKLLEGLEDVEHTLSETLKANEQFQRSLRDFDELLEDWSKGRHILPNNGI